LLQRDLNQCLTIIADVRLELQKAGEDSCRSFAPARLNYLLAGVAGLLAVVATIESVVVLRLCDDG
jgi:hypothetical protein